MKGTNDVHWRPFESKLGMVRLVLSVDWDPIGVFGHPAALGEYDGYAFQVLALAVKTKSPQQIAELLAELERDRMGIEHGSEETRISAATKIVDALAHFEGSLLLAGDDKGATT